ncbi:MAG: tetratricopeptide repeat protein [Oligoflexales bacterium]
MRVHIIPFVFMLSLAVAGCQTNDAEIKDTETIDTVTVGTDEGTLEVKKSERIKPESWRTFFKPESTGVDQQMAGEANAAKASVDEARKAVGNGDFEKAEAILLEHIRENEDAFDVRLELVQVYLKMNKSKKTWPFLEETRKYLDKAEKPNPELNFKYRYVLALAHLKEGNSDKAKKILSSLIAEDKTFIPAYALLASHYLSKGKISIAEFVAKQGIDRGGEEERLTNLMGSINSKLGKHQDALSWFDRSLKHSPGYAPALMNRAGFYITRGEFDLAQKDLAPLEQSHANDASFCLLRGILYGKQNQDQLALASLEKALQLDPENPHIRYHLAVLFEEKLDDNANALRLFQEAMQLSGENSPLQELAEWHVRSLATREFAQAYLR